MRKPRYATFVVTRSILINGPYHEHLIVSIISVATDVVAIFVTNNIQGSKTNKSQLSVKDYAVIVIKLPRVTANFALPSPVSGASKVWHAWLCLLEQSLQVFFSIYTLSTSDQEEKAVILLVFASK